RLCYFYDDRTADSAQTTMIRCTQWGIPFVVYSGWFRSADPLLGVGTWSRTFNWAADNGTMMFAAAGNETEKVDNTFKRPATGTPRVVTVGATEADGTRATFSNWGAAVDIWAPGVDIPVVPVPDPAPDSLDGQLAGGTSLSTPIVAGVAAMMRAVNPALSVDQIRHMLVNTGWTGQGHVTTGLDAYAAVWAAMADRMTEDALDPVDEQLYPDADGRFQPIFNDVINRGGDVDTFLLDVPAFSTVVVNLEWYARLATIDLQLENTDPEAATPAVTLHRAPGHAKLTALVGSGTYRIALRGDGPTAYLLQGRYKAARLAPDRFEGNNSFETATRLRVQTSLIPWQDAPVFNVHGPGSFALNLHTAEAPPVTTDLDYFRIDVPADIGELYLPQILIGSDEPVDVTRFDKTRTVTAQWHAARAHTVNLPKGQTSYLRVSGNIHTRYSLWVGLGLNPGALRKQWQRELPVVSDWWVVPPEHPEWITQPEELRGVVLTDQAIADATLRFQTAALTSAKPAQLELLRDDGEVVDVAEFADGGAASFDVTDLNPGPYVLRITSTASRSRPLLFTAAAPPVPTDNGRKAPGSSSRL
ncbi:S8 family serine peptidase, partial [Mycolicibacterium fortuitum]